MIAEEKEQFDETETKRRFEAALRGAREVGHKPQSEMKLGKAKTKRAKAKKKPGR